MRIFLLVVALLLASGTAYGKDCRNLDKNPGPATYTGILQATVLEMENGMSTNCFRLVLDKPVCLSSEFIGAGAEIRAVQLLPPEGLKLPESGRWQVTGDLATGETQWFCENVVLNVSTLTRVEQGVAVAKIEVPVFKNGDGLLGYGIPTRQVLDVGVWKHKTKDVLKKAGLSLLRVEFYRNDTYPVFFVSGRKIHTAQESNDPQKFGAVVEFARAVLDANSGWAFELVDQYGIRYKYDKVKGGAGYGFDIQMP